MEDGIRTLNESIKRVTRELDAITMEKVAPIPSYSKCSARSLRINTACQLTHPVHDQVRLELRLKNIKSEYTSPKTQDARCIIC